LSLRMRRAVLAILLLALAAGACSSPVTPYPFHHQLLGWLKVEATLSDAGGVLLGIRMLTVPDSVKVRLLGANDSTRTITGQWVFRTINGTYEGAAEVAGVPTDSTRAILIQNLDIATTDTLKVRRTGDLHATPNPFTTATSLTFALPANDDVSLRIVTLAG